MKRASAEQRAAAAALLYVCSIQTHTYRHGIHFFGAVSSFFPCSAFFPWATPAGVVVFWVLSLGALCVEAEAEDLEACVGFEVELEGCRRRLPSSPAEDE